METEDDCLQLSVVQKPKNDHVSLPCNMYDRCRLTQTSVGGETDRPEERSE